MVRACSCRSFLFQFGAFVRCLRIHLMNWNAPSSAFENPVPPDHAPTASGSARLKFCPRMWTYQDA
jgi:hypothetical protein